MHRFIPLICSIVCCCEGSVGHAGQTHYKGSVRWWDARTHREAPLPVPVSGEWSRGSVEEDTGGWRAEMCHSCSATWYAPAHSVTVTVTGSFALLLLLIKCKILYFVHSIVSCTVRDIWNLGWIWLLFIISVHLSLLALLSHTSL